MALCSLVRCHCIALYCGIAQPCIVACYRLVSWHCIALYCGLLFSRHPGSNLILRFASMIVKIILTNHLMMD